MIFIWHFLTDVATLKLNKDIYTKIETLPKKASPILTSEAFLYIDFSS